MSSYYPESYDYYADEVATEETSMFQHHASGETPTAEIIIIEPISFEEIPEAIQALRNQQMVVLNLAQMSFEEAQRSIDFLAGGILMFNGTIEKIDQKIFLFAPYSTEIIHDGHQERQHNIAAPPATNRINPLSSNRTNSAFWKANTIHQIS